MSNKYISVIYNEKSHPYTDYPSKLCSYLFQVYNFKKGMRLLEPGCGRGEFITNFKKLGLEVFGLDLSREAQSFNKNIDIRTCNVENEGIPFKDNYFDIIYSKSFIEHLYYPEKYLKEAYRVLKPGGVILTLVPDWETNYKIYFDDFTHRTPFTIYSLKDAYEIYGFKEVNVYKFRQLPIVWRFPMMNYFCMLISPFIKERSKIKFLRWSKELMIIGSGKK